LTEVEQYSESNSKL